MFQLYRGSQFYWWRKPENPAKTTDRKFSILQRYNAPTLFSKFAESFNVLGVEHHQTNKQANIIICNTFTLHLVDPDGSMS
jgi:hypothetical protein